ncbi:MAG: PDZ domain-containing protein [Gemmatimonadales bacterium]|nr:MAG: PDZ domain-containing protein [Gemmatimonadales bacterium]
MNPRRALPLLAFLLLPLVASFGVPGTALGAAPATDDPDRVGYYHSPTLHGETLVFVSEGDLWAVSASGGTARRLTSHATAESEPHLSPDGQTVAFTARYDGAPDVWVMPLEGGPAQRLTWEGDGVEVQGWTPDGEVVYATGAAVGPSWFRLLRTVDPETGAITEIPLADARQGAFDGAGTLFFTRFGLDLTGDNAREYRGGTMAQLWRFDLEGGSEAIRLAADREANLTRPMYWDGHLYLVSDEDGLFNLWRMNPDGSGAEPLTEHRDFEVRGATLSADGRITYQHGADLRIYDIATGTDRVVSIELGSDRSRTRIRWLDSPLDYLDSSSLSPDAQRVALTARGHLALAGTGEIRRIEIPLPEASRAREAVVSPDGDWVYAFVDAEGEQEIWRFPADGRGSGEALTSDGAGHRTGMYVSPDGQRIAHTDRRGNLWLLDLESRENRRIDGARGMSYRDVVWSPDSRALAVVRPDSPMRRPQLVLLELESGEAHTLTSDRYESYSPAFTPDGRWLFFLSDRHFSPTPGGPWGDRNLGPLFDRRTRIYGLALQPDASFPLTPRTELTPRGGEARESGSPGPGGGGNPGASGAVDGDVAGGGNGSGGNDLPAIVYSGLAERLHEVPVAPGNYSGLLATGSRLYFFDRVTGQAGPPSLQRVDFGPDTPRVETFAEGITQAQLSGDRSRLLVRRSQGGELLIVPAGAQLPSELREARVRLGGWRLAVDPRQEWRQMYVDAWRMQRDFLFDPEMRGQDWEAVRDKYAFMVDRIGDRRELDDVLAQMVAELSVLHSQVRGGDYTSNPEEGRPSFLGGTFTWEEGGARIEHIYRTDPELPSERSPLARPGVELRAGDVITAINGRAIRSAADMERALSHQAGEQVRLDYIRDGEEGSVVTHPVAGGRDAALRYSDWVMGRREAVDAAADGRIGYLHLRAMGAGDMADFAREFYANIDREGLIIDVRRNRGGNIDSWIIEKLLRRAWSFWEPPGQDPYWNMQQTFRGHLVVLMDPLTYSDGETFSAGVKALELGPLVGERTSGAGVWLSNNNLLVDRGISRSPQTPQFGADGRWIIEGFGVEPDIRVDNLPHATWRGEDAQLQRAIRELLETLEAHPVEQPPAEPIAPAGTPARD